MAFQLWRQRTTKKASYWAAHIIFPPIAAFCAIYVMALITRSLLPNFQAPVVAASIGASAVIVFITPNSPFSAPWPLIGGHFVSALIGITSAISIHDTALSSAVAVGGAMLMMGLLRCMNPPGAATALAPILSQHQQSSFEAYFILLPLMLNVVLLVIFSALINKLVRAMR